MPVDALLDAGQFGPFFRRHKRERDPFTTHTSGSSDAMDVVVTELGRIEVDNVGDSRDVDAASDHIGGDQAADFSGPESLHDLVARSLGHISMNTGGMVNVFSKPAIERFRAAFGAAEDDGLLRLFPRQQANQQFVFASVFDGEIRLLNRLDRDIGGREVEHFRLEHVPFGQAFDGWWNGGAQQQRLSIGRALAKDLFDIGAEADVQHAIRFVQHHELQFVEFERATAHVVHDTSGRTDDDIGPAAQFLDLTANWHTAVDRHTIQFAAVREFHDFAAHLHRQFTGWHQDQGPRSLAGMCFEYFDDGNGESGRLSGSGAGLPHQINPLNGLGNHAGLNGSGLFIACHAQRLKGCRGQPEFLKLRRRIRFAGRFLLHCQGGMYPHDENADQFGIEFDPSAVNLTLKMSWVNRRTGVGSRRPKDLHKRGARWAHGLGRTRLPARDRVRPFLL